MRCAVPCAGEDVARSPRGRDFLMWVRYYMGLWVVVGVLWGFVLVYWFCFVLFCFFPCCSDIPESKLKVFDYM